MHVTTIDLGAPPPATPLPLAGLTLGVFDGLHRGHRHLIDTLCSGAFDAGRGRARGALALVTFTRFPEEVLHGHAPVRLISRGQRDRLLADWGIDRVIELETNRELLALEPEQFIERLFMHVAPRAVVVGGNFRFGRAARGNGELIAQLAKGKVHVVEPLVDETGLPVSATRVRTALGNGEIEDANRLLGRHYSVIAAETAGDGIGRTIGSPTLNLLPLPEPVRDGIYIVSTPHAIAVAHLGPRPAFHAIERRFEVHVIEHFQHSPDGQWEVAFHRRLRDVMDFPNPAALAAQIREDVQMTREYFASESGF